MITELFILAYYTNASLGASFCASDPAWPTTQLSLLLALSLNILITLMKNPAFRQY